MQRSAQETFWAGEFGDEYTHRNETDDKNNMDFWRHVVGYCYEFDSIMEFGANVGSNIKCLRKIFPSASFGALELNEVAVGKLLRIPKIKVYDCSIFDYPGGQWEFVFTKGVLIHLAPDLLKHAYDIIYNASSKYILLAEYYSPTPCSIPYRGHTDCLFKRDFAGEMMDRYKLSLIDYGFVYHRDEYPQDDVNWFMMEKL